MKVSELEGSDLDYWVAKAEGLALPSNAKPDDLLFSSLHGGIYHPSTNWLQGGPLIERERIKLLPAFDWSGNENGWNAFVRWQEDGRNGPTPLIAAMRAFVASKFGEEVDDE